MEGEGTEAGEGPGSDQLVNCDLGMIAGSPVGQLGPPDRPRRLSPETEQTPPDSHLIHMYV